MALGHSIAIQTTRHYERGVQSDESLQHGKSTMITYHPSNKFMLHFFFALFLAMEILQLEHLQFESAQTSRTGYVHQNRPAIVPSRPEELFARLSQLRRDARRGQENARQQQQRHYAPQCHGVFRTVRRFDRLARSIDPFLFMDSIRSWHSQALLIFV